MKIPFLRGDFLCFSAALFAIGTAAAATEPYVSVIALEFLKMETTTFALVISIGSILAAASSLALGLVSDLVRSRRAIIVLCCMIGALAYALIFFFQSTWAFIVAYAVMIPFSGAMFSQVFSFARTYFSKGLDGDTPVADKVIGTLRAVFATSWIAVPPLAGFLAGASSPVSVYAVASGACMACAMIFMVAAPADQNAEGSGPTPLTRKGFSFTDIHKATLVGLLALILIRTAMVLHSTTMPLVIVTKLGGTLADVGMIAGLAALLEVPLMIGWGLLSTRLPHYAAISIASIAYALYLFLLAGASSVTDVLLLQVVNAVASAALLSIPISYVQGAIRGRVGLSTSLYDLVSISASLVAAGVFAIIASSGTYQAIIAVAAVLALVGAAVMLVAHQVLDRVTADPN